MMTTSDEASTILRNVNVICIFSNCSAEHHQHFDNVILRISPTPMNSSPEHSPHRQQEQTTSTAFRCSLPSIPILDTTSSSCSSSSPSYHRIDCQTAPTAMSLQPTNGTPFGSILSCIESLNQTMESIESRTDSFYSIDNLLTTKQPAAVDDATMIVVDDEEDDCRLATGKCVCSLLRMCRFCF